MNDISIAPEGLEPTESPLTALPAAVLTAPGGPHPIKDDLRQILAMTADGKVHVSPQHVSDHYVMSFLDQLEHKGIEFQVVSASMTEIKALYQASATTGMKALVETQRQAQVVEFMGDAHRRGASDIHIVVSHDVTRIKYRLFGVLQEVRQEKSDVGREFCAALYNSMCDVSGDYYQPHIAQDARVSRKFVDQLGLYGARVATRPLVDGPLMVMRLLYDDTSKQSFEELGFLPQQVEHFRRLRSLPYGLNLITGPTGSGKSKTLQVNLNALYDETGGSRHILTLEHPPEYPLKANQSPIYAGEAWGDGITNAVRLDPDVLMYGELRDLASAQAAYTGAMTGHQSWSTLHTNNAIASIQRLIDMGVADYLVTDPLLTTGIVNQSLVPVLCPACRIPLREHTHGISSDLLARLEQLQIVDQVNLIGDGCNHCKNLGVVDRTVIAETLLTNVKLMDTFSRRGASAARRFWVNEMGGITKITHAIMKITEGAVDPRDAELFAGPLDFDRQLMEQSDA